MTAIECRVGEGQCGVEERDRADMTEPDRVRTEWGSMRTSDQKVFAAGDGAFGGSTIVMAMQHGQRAAYYVRHYLEGNRDSSQSPRRRRAPERSSPNTFLSRGIDHLRRPLAMLMHDPDHSVGEERYLVLAASSTGRLLVVSHAERPPRTRLISAGPATRNERKHYEQDT